MLLDEAHTDVSCCVGDLEVLEGGGDSGGPALTQDDCVSECFLKRNMRRRRRRDLTRVSCCCAK